jgi:hypothetical protein
MKNQPVDGNGQFEGENESGDNVKEAHSGGFRLFFSEHCVQRQVADQAENHQPSPCVQPWLAPHTPQPTKEALTKSKK